MRWWMLLITLETPPPRLPRQAPVGFTTIIVGLLTWAAQLQNAAEGRWAVQSADRYGDADPLAVDSYPWRD